MRPGKFDAGRCIVDPGAAVAKDNLALHTTADIKMYKWSSIPFFQEPAPAVFRDQQNFRRLPEAATRFDRTWAEFLSRHEGNGSAASRSLQINSKGAAIIIKFEKKKQWNTSLESFYFHSLQPGVPPGIFL